MLLAGKHFFQKTTASYFNRELSWLAFNRRVLEQAKNTHYPVLERLRFLSFVSSNLDEFFEIRVAGLLQQLESNIQEIGPDGLGVQQQLTLIHEQVQSLVNDQYTCWDKKLLPALKKEHIVFKDTEYLSPKDIIYLKKYFSKEIYPVLTPLAIDPSHPFPQLANKALYILVHLKLNDRTKNTSDKMAIIPAPRILPRVFSLPSKKNSLTFITLVDILRLFADDLFPGYQVRGTWAFRITRNSDMYIDEEEAQSLLNKIEDELTKLKRGSAVRLEIDKDVTPKILTQLLNTIHEPSMFVYFINGPINLARMLNLYEKVDRPDLKFKPFVPHIPHQLTNSSNIFEVISKQDLLLHHPYHSFTPVVDFIRQAGQDPQVYAIKQTLYRTGGDSPIIKALMEAAENGKQVTVLVELRARFDEANNIQWAKQMEEVGIHVLYGLAGLKTHCKACLVVRNETKGLKRYTHLGTGNYNSKTSKFYTDFSLFTANEDITSEVADLFNTLTGYAVKPSFKTLMVAPFNFHTKIQDLILREAKNAQKGRPAKIIAKMNSLLDKQTIDNLYYASQCGVKIELIVRGICALVPGVKGLSENITVRSILGQYLEHSRLFYFENAQDSPEIFVGSADWMPRNFYRRIEIIYPILSPILKAYFLNVIIPTYLKDNAQAQFLNKTGHYCSAPVHKKGKHFSEQEEFKKLAELKASPLAFSDIHVGL